MRKQLININGRLLNLREPKIMAIVNATPDSFFSNSRLGDILPSDYVQQLLNEGADIIDIGACSTRPGSTPPSETEEWTRLEPVLKNIRSCFPEIIISLDTFRAKIAERAVYEYGVNIINDISGGLADAEMFSTVEKLNVPYILTHNSPDQANTMADIVDFLQQRINTLQRLGAKDIIIDPGFGFGKTVEENYEVMSGLERLQMLKLPVLVALSRKSMIYRLLGTSQEEALTGTIVLDTIALMKGANILWVHDVREAVECVKIVAAAKPQLTKSDE